MGTGEISIADYYRKINDRLPVGAIRLKIAITDCGHNPNFDDLDTIPKVGDRVNCFACRDKLVKVIEIVE